MNGTDQPDPRASARRPRWRTAFTLVELLTVVAIIALLIALLMPALRMAKQKAHATFCANNLRQVGVAIHAYTGEHSGHFLGLYTPYWGKGGGSGWFSFLGRAGYFGQQISFRKQHVDNRYGGLTENWRWPLLRCPAEQTIDFMIPADYYSGVPYNNYLNEYITSSYDANFTMINITDCGWCYNCPCVAYNFTTPTAPGATTANALIVMDNGFCNNENSPNHGGTYYNYFGISWGLPNFHAYTLGGSAYSTAIQDIRGDPLRMHAFRHPGGVANGLFLDGHVDRVLPFFQTAPANRPVLWIWYWRGTMQDGWKG
ncbi:DUF1559 domain-containing protein [bacterium]|nr:DUF1559 domain-containing protein [bacterium]